MIPRLLQLTEDESFFLFGARSTGKTTLLKHLPWLSQALYINLLSASEEKRFTQNPDNLADIVQQLPPQKTHIVIDEIQKIPKLLDVVHHLIETTDKKFILTGSSARKLKYGGANLLAGRAFVYSLFPFCYLELGDQFDLNSALHYGLLPRMLEFKHEAAGERKKRAFLYAYTNTYLKEEVWAELFVRDINAFRHFLEVAAQMNAKQINYSKIARDVGVDVKTIQQFFSILEDTLLGFYLNPFEHSFRKRISKSPKFYFFDMGIVNKLTGLLSVPLQPGTSRYGELFEHFIILQCLQLNQYYHLDYWFSYLQTKDGAEIDLIVERPGKAILFIEIKSSPQVTHQQLKNLKRFKDDYGDCEAVCFSRDEYAKKVNDITVYPWREGIETYFMPSDSMSSDH